MTDARRGFFRHNLILIAAFALPAAVAVLFILATAIPRWTVPDPQHDFLVRAERPWESPPSEVTVEFTERNGQVVAIVRPVPKPDPKMAPYGVPQAPRWGLLRFDHESRQLREVAVNLPTTVQQGETHTIPVDALAGVRVLPGATAPDGYQIDTSFRSGRTGIVGDLFGMNGGRYGRRLAVARDGRTVEVSLPAPYRDSYGQMYPLGWIADESR